VVRGVWFWRDNCGAFFARLADLLACVMPVCEFVQPAANPVIQPSMTGAQCQYYQGLYVMTADEINQYSQVSSTDVYGAFSVGFSSVIMCWLLGKGVGAVLHVLKRS
jgi:hypothetical protein